jgi:hypothetical protein
MIWSEVVLEVALPLILIAWLAFGSPNRIAWALQAILTGGYLTGISLIATWLVVPFPVLFILITLYLFAIAFGILRGSLHSPLEPGARALIGVVVRGAFIAVLIPITSGAWNGRRIPADPVALSFPLHGGTFGIANGGATEWVNAHIETLGPAPGLRDFRGQSYGVDVIEMGRLGTRATGVRPADPARYRIFGETVYAPCNGRVVVALDGIVDQRPPQRDRRNMAGNHVIVDCDHAWVLLGHLERGSIVVRVGDSVQPSDPIGSVGNSGNSDEPHLHIHAQRPGSARAPLDGQPIPIIFGGRYLVRNQRIHSD